MFGDRPARADKIAVALDSAFDGYVGIDGSLCDPPLLSWFVLELGREIATNSVGRVPEDNVVQSVGEGGTDWKFPRKPVGSDVCGGPDSTVQRAAFTGDNEGR